MLTFRFLGTGNAFGAGGRRQSCYLIETDKIILLDAGYATLSALRSVSLDISQIDAILISHVHPDHYMGLPQFVLEDYYVIKRETSIPVFGPIGLKDKLTEITAVMYNQEVADHLTELYDILEYGPNETFDFLNGNVQTLDADHTGNAQMQIITINGNTIGYTGDTALMPSNLTKLLECDLVISEASSFSNSIPHHTTVEELQNFANPQGKTIYLTHVGESVLQNIPNIKLPLVLASDGLIVYL